MSMICFGNCVFLKKINNPFGVSPFFSGKVSISIGRETRTHIIACGSQRCVVAKVGPSHNNFCRKNQSDTTSIIQSGEAPF